MLEHVKMSLLADYYGGLLTKHQLKIVRGYYDEDLSLNELAEETGVTRQAVYDNDILRRAGDKLKDYEAKLGLVSKITCLISRIETVMVSTDTKTAQTLREILDEVKEI